MKVIHFLKKCGDCDCGGHIACGSTVNGCRLWDRGWSRPKQTTFKRSKVTCGNCKRTKVYRGKK